MDLLGGPAGFCLAIFNLGTCADYLHHWQVYSCSSTSSCTNASPGRSYPHRRTPSLPELFTTSVQVSGPLATSLRADASMAVESTPPVSRQRPYAAIPRPHRFKKTIISNPSRAVPILPMSSVKLFASNASNWSKGAAMRWLLPSQVLYWLYKRASTSFYPAQPPGKIGTTRMRLSTAMPVPAVQVRVEQGHRVSQASSALHSIHCSTHSPRHKRGESFV